VTGTVTAVGLFPGQGSHQVGMGRDLAAAFPVARRVFAEADEVLGSRLSRLCFEGPQEELRLTEHAQPAILAVSVATHRVLAETAGFAPAMVCGHSLGEWSALVAAGALAFADAVHAVRERGRLMQSAVPAGQGAMAAVLGLDAEAAAALCVEAAGDEVLTPANYNGGGQVVVAGHAGAVQRLVALAKERRARAQLLAVSAPFHCPLMAPAADGLRAVVAGMRFREPAIPIVTSVEARRVTGATELPELLVRQVTAPVQWERTIRVVVEAGATLALETGPGRVLTGLLRRIAPDLTGVPVGDVDGVARAKEALG
jgi:[acyl-carrier-protein] S-malonyltransferase